ncbi:DUF2334 domain-containing protein [Candidatus Nomurabacteria bacterium]|nr:DUF2334 domain-containing protein [Candidatus Nomurabacteria bacterium]
MKFIIRDDDTNFFTKPQDIENLYSSIFKRNISVGLSVIPFVSSLSDVYPWNISEEKKEYLVSENIDLVNYINSNINIDIFQHGCTHEKINNVFEYLQNKNLKIETLRGKEELEKTFKRKVDIFVPPHDQISNNGIIAIENARMNIIRSKGSKNFLFRIEYVFVILKMILHKLNFFNLSSLEMPAYPYIVDCGKHQEAYSFRVELGLDILKKGLLYAKKINGNFILVNHLHMMSEENKKIFLEIVDYAQELGFDFIKPSILFKDEK